MQTYAQKEIIRQVKFEYEKLQEEYRLQGKQLEHYQDQEERLSKLRRMIGHRKNEKPLFDNEKYYQKYISVLQENIKQSGVTSEDQLRRIA